MSKAIGSIYIDIEARTAKLEEGLEKAKRQMGALNSQLQESAKGAGTSWDALGFKFLKFNVYAQASAAAVAGVAQAFRDVVANADVLSRQGFMSADAAAGVRDYQVAMGRLSVATRSAASEGVSFFSQTLSYLDELEKTAKDQWGTLGQAVFRATPIVSVKNSALEGLGGQAEDLTAVEAAAIEAAGGVAQYAKALDDAKLKLKELHTAEAMAGMDRQDRIAQLDKLIAAAQRYQKNTQLPDLARVQGQLRESTLTAQRDAEAKIGREQLSALTRGLDVAQAKIDEAKLANVDRLAKLQQEVVDGERVLNDLKASGLAPSRAQIEALQTLTDRKNTLAALEQSMTAIEGQRAVAAIDQAHAVEVARLSGEEKFQAMLRYTADLEAKLAAERDTGRKATLESRIAAAKATAEAFKTESTGKTYDAFKALDDSRARLGQKSLTDLEALRGLEAQLASERYAGVEALREKSMLTEEELALVQEVTRLETERASLRARTYASDKDALSTLRDLEDARLRQGREHLTDQEEMQRNLQQIEELTAGIDFTRMVSGGKYTNEELDRLKRAAELYRENGRLIEQNRRRMEQFGESLVQTFTDGAMRGAKLSDIFKDLARQLANYVIQQALIKPLGNMVGSLFGSFGSALGSWGSAASAGATAGSTSSLFSTAGAALGGGRASGGPVVAGTPYLVGEQGPELFTPNTSGMVSTAQATAKRADELAMTFSTTYNVAAGVTAAELRPILEQHAKIVQAQTRASLLNDLARGGRRASMFMG